MNPFLREFATDPESNALETEFAFLMIHFHQLKACGLSRSRERSSEIFISQRTSYTRE